MGLRLYQPPVASDVVSAKPAAEKNSAQTRSVIRRARLARSPRRPARSDASRREYIRTMIESGASGYHVQSPPLNGRSPSPQRHPPPPPPNREPSAGRAAIYSAGWRGAGSRDDRVVAMFGERWDRWGLPPVLDGDRNTPPPALLSSDAPRGRPVIHFDGMPREPYTTSNVRSTPGPSYSRPGMLERARRSIAAEAQPSEGASSTRTRGEPTREEPTREERRLRRRAMREAATPSLPRGATLREHAQALLASIDESQPAYDGLGDRNRSISPEGDNVWDTIVSTLQSDPQPPSVGSSFASTSASAAASQSAVARSSSTPLTNLDTADESAFEHPCESGCEASDVDEDGEEDGEENLLRRFPSGLRLSRRSYAEVARERSNSQNDDDLETMVGIAGMQRIVRSLAQREDIPDEWWAQAGLSRSFSREESAN